MTAIFAHDQTVLFYPAAPGCVYAITLDDLAYATSVADEPAAFASATDTLDLADMLITSATMGDAEVDQQRTLYPLTARPSVAPPAFVQARTGALADGAGDLADDFADALEAWADWCDLQAAAEDGEDVWTTEADAIDEAGGLASAA